MAASQNKIDKRFIKLYICQKMSEKGVQMRFENDDFINQKRSLQIAAPDLVHRLMKKRSITMIDFDRGGLADK